MSSLRKSKIVKCPSKQIVYIVKEIPRFVISFFLQLTVFIDFLIVFNFLSLQKETPIVIKAAPLPCQMAAGIYADSINFQKLKGSTKIVMVSLRLGYFEISCWLFKSKSPKRYFQ